VVQTGHVITTTAAWTVSGAGNKIQIEGGGTITTTFLIITTTFQVDNLGTYNHNFIGSGASGSSTDTQAQQELVIEYLVQLQLLI